MALHVHRATGMQIKHTDTVNISLQFRIIDKSPISYVILYRQIIPLRYKTRVMKILCTIILKYLTFNTYTLVASRKKIALHTRSHQKLGTHCCVQRSPTNRLDRFLQQKVKQCGSKHYYHLIQLKKNKNQRYIAKINKISWQAKALTALHKSLNLTAKQRMQRLPEARSSFICNVSELL